METMRKVVLSLGSNLGDRLQVLEKAINKLTRRFPRNFKQSSFYETLPWGFETENLFLNCCVIFDDTIQPEELLEVTQEIEREFGRELKSNNGSYASRVLDIDIIYMGNTTIKTEKLTIPHPLMYVRNFVLRPLVEILPNFVDPLCNQSVKELLDRCNDENNVLLYNK
ncbi:2-amino-4-hydroxy-6-hydroxymethyldihydropteridine diphosphokinase [Brumimicrobium salinarum]|uniref:2-amino-4-hydroxy-6-hydroxymethyldihydropteridine pyrophosphokinase n=1 Tax=Brumimicrobium salinarum TaxID=2058658 RepID=A0A2I0QZZ0_9FLAO|nr:2-amino-4-hydroxy-6-hydroxymethyldihydropteridine diphosphokinase [Brumimicrobium salinarum]PKR79906.1 2-amino-4-hydroxy-6-hydroxymethyldihydropteridine diphosphokinase [Brumimicrobium salinarum]